MGQRIYRIEENHPLTEADVVKSSHFIKKILICTKVVEERVAVLIQGYNDRVLERGQIRKSPGVD